MPSALVGASVAYGNGVFVAMAGGTTNAAYSTNGINWTACPGGMPSAVNWSGVAYGNGVFVAISYGTNAAYSTNGINWTACPEGMPSADGYWCGVAYGIGTFVAISYGTNAAYSTNGINWTASPGGLPSAGPYSCWFAVAARYTGTNESAAPFILTQPLSQTAGVGGSITFSVAAFGAPPLSYQWQQNGVNLADAGNISGSSTANLTITNLALSDAALYSVLVSNTAGTVESIPASLTVLGFSGTSFYIPVFGPLGSNYWVMASTNLANWTTLGGDTLITTPTFFIDAGASNFAYRFYEVWNGAGYSNPFGFVTIAVPGGKTNLLADQLVDYPNTLVPDFQLPTDDSMDGSTVTEWVDNLLEVSTFGLASESWSSPGLPIAPGGGAYFYNSSNGQFAVTFVGTVPQGALTNPIPEGVSFRSAMLPLAGSADALGLTAALTNGDYVYQWIVSGQTNQVYLITNGAWSVLSNSLWVSSSAPFLQVGEAVLIDAIANGGPRVWSNAPPDPPKITIQPQSQMVFQGNTVYFSVGATNTNTPPATLTYQWYFDNSSLTNGGNISGATSATLTISDAQTANEGTYWVLVGIVGTNGTATSTNVILSVTNSCRPVPAPDLSWSEPNGLYVLDISPTVTAITYELWFTTNWITYIPYPFVATNNPTKLAIGGLPHPGYFYLEIAGGMDLPTITTPPVNEEVGPGTNVTFSVAATGLSPLSFQWQFNGTNLTNGGPISGATTSNLTISNAAPGNVGTYTVIVANLMCTASAEAWLALPWSTYLTNGFDASPAIGPDGTIYIANTAGQFFALDPVLGDIKWSTNLGSGSDDVITSSAAVAANGSAVYVGSLDGTLYALNATNGGVLWSTQLGRAIFSSPAISASDGTIYVGAYYSGSNGVIAVNPLSGEVEWVFQTDDQYAGIASGIDSSPAIGQDCTIYFLSSSGDLYAVSTNGTLKWFFPLPAGSYPDSSPAIGEDGTIYVGSGDGYLYAISPSGTLEWIFDTAFDTGDSSSPIQSSPAIGGDGTVYMASTYGILYALTNGNLKWAFTNSPYVSFISSPAVAADGTVYIGSEDYNVYAITNGAVKWTVQTSNQVLSSPAIAANGAVYIGSEDGYVYALQGSAGLASSAWPMFHHDAHHTGATPNPNCSSGASLVAFPNNGSFPSSGEFRFQVSGTPGSSWAIFASSNLATWNLIGSVSLDAIHGYDLFSDTNVAGVTNRFYEAQSGNYCSQVIGFINMTIPPGTNIIANQFYQVYDGYAPFYPQNTANGLLSFMDENSFPLPDGTEIMIWNGIGFETNTFLAYIPGWVPNGDAKLLPGEAAFITNAADFTIPFVGLVLKGLSANPIVAGTNYVSSIVPWAGLIHSILNYNPNNGDKVLLWTGSNYSTNTYYTNSGWTSNEPVIGVGQGFVLVASQTNLWQQSFSACDTGLFVVPSNPLWTDTGFHLSSNDTVTFRASGTWDGGAGTCGPGGLAGGGSLDPFLANAADFSLIAFVGQNPYYWGTNYEWVYGNTYFPQQSSSNGYWAVGSSNGVFTTDRAGELWFGFNDDAVYKIVGDNTGFVAGQIEITGP
jgi:outer membrane protein assembly factor BamB